MLKNPIYAKTKDLFLDALGTGNIPYDSIVFIEDTKEIWNHGQYFSKDVSDMDLRQMSVPYSELVELRNNSQLLPGRSYRITDYITTTTQTNTQSAWHRFDIIVTADSENTLNEKAKAIQHEDDTYFAESDLNAWQIWYSLDNDTNRFAWADVTNGKGVIYRMIDEFGNDCPYDFKNIQFKHPNNTDDTNWYYTFDASSTDATVSNNVICAFNVIKPYLVNHKVQHLNNNIFIVLTKCVYNVFQNNCYNNNFGDNAIANSLDTMCHHNSFEGTGCQLNSLGCNSYSNKFLGKTQRNTIFPECKNNTLGADFNGNTIGCMCTDNVIGTNCNGNRVADGFRYNIIGDDCRKNNFGPVVLKNTIGNNFDANDVCGVVQRNVFGNDYIGNHFSVNVVDNVFGNNFQYNTFNTGCFNLNIGNNFQRNTFAERLNNINIVNTESEDTPIQNYKFCAGISGTEESPTNINCIRNTDYETKVAKNSSGKILTYCEADLIAVPLTLISFTVGSVNHEAEEGMTWGEWVHSEYNTVDYRINNTSNITSISGLWLKDLTTDYFVETSELIKSNGKYIMATSPYAGSDD